MNNTTCCRRRVDWPWLGQRQGSKAVDVAAMIEACVSAYDRIDVLDNNVGIAEVSGLVEVLEADWDRVFAV